MSCCGPKSKVENGSPNSCPECNQVGTKINSITLNSHLLDQCKNELKKDGLYKFCKTPSCDVVYFSSDGVVYHKDNLREKVTVKDDGLDVKTCYCFGVTKRDIVKEITQTGVCTSLDMIKAKMKEPGCFCETANPQGGCCLANNMAFIKEVKSKEIKI